MAQRRGGTIEFKIDGQLMDAKGDFTYNLGRPKREPIVGADGIHGYKEMPQVASIEGEITDRGTLDLDTVLQATAATVTLTLANGKIIVLKDAWYGGDGTVNSGEGNVQILFQSNSADEVS